MTRALQKNLWLLKLFVGRKGIWPRIKFWHFRRTSFLFDNARKFYGVKSVLFFFQTYNWEEPNFSTRSYVHWQIYKNPWPGPNRVKVPVRKKQLKVINAGCPLCAFMKHWRKLSLYPEEGMGVGRFTKSIKKSIKILSIHWHTLILHAAT